MKNKTDFLILNAILVTMDKDLRIINRGAIAISGSHILAIGSQENILTQYDSDNNIDACGGIVLPGLINTHTHLAMVLLRGLAEDLELPVWLKKVWKAEHAVMTPDTVELGARLGIIESIMSGTTCAVDMYWYPDRTARAAQSLGFRLANGPVFLDSTSAPDGLAFMDRCSLTRDFIAEFQADPLIIPMIMPHSTATDSPAFLKQVKSLADRYGVMLNMHCAETEGEVKTVINQHGKPPVSLLESIGLLDNPIILAHCVHVTKQEILTLAKKRVLVAHNPVSNMKLASGIAPVFEMLQAGVNVSLGTDGAQSSNDLNMWLPIRLTALLQKVQHFNASVITAQEVIKMATIDAATGIGLGNQIGSLEAGKIADLIVIKNNTPHMVPMFDPYAQLVYSAGRDDVNHVMINGKWVMFSRKLITGNLQDCLDKVSTFAKDIEKFS